MKAKFLWASLLLFAGITACTDDAIETQTGNSSKGEGTPAYLTISFTANGESSTRAADDDNSGDTHGDAEDSKHESAGIEGESSIKTALVVVSPVSTADDAFGFAKVYTMKDAASAADGDFTLIDEQSKTYGTAAPIEVETGDYNVLVVINPATSLTDAVDQATQQITDVATVRNLYNTILTGQYAYDPGEQVTTYPDNYTNAANSIGMGLGYSSTNTSKDNAAFMMANKAAASVTVDAGDTPTDPATVDVTVERVLSKITFRETTPTETGVANVYKVPVTLGTAPAVTVSAVVQKNGDPQPPTYGAEDVMTLNKATDAVDQTVYAAYDEQGDLENVYKAVIESSQEKTVEVEVGGEKVTCIVCKLCTAVTEDKYNETGTDKTVSYVKNAAFPYVDLVLDPNAPIQTEDWYVKLEGYALVNLAKSVNYVRHTIGVGGGIESPFGTLGISYYLWTPNWAAKNGVNIGDEDFTIEDSWFYNSLKKVSDESKTLAVSGSDISWQEKGCFKSFTSGLINDGSEVSGEKDHYGEDPILPAVGKLMSYCFENSTDQSHQVHGLSTGISFVGRIYKDKDCAQPIEKLYLYAGHNFTSLQQIKEAYGSITPQDILDMIDGTTPETKENLEKAGVTLYNSNVCYYYTTEIKHFDNGINDGQDGALGVNEFIIMRNNIYSLAVTTIEDIGAPFVDPTPNTPNESVKAALQVNVKIVPWTVRYNDIEF